MPPSRACRQCRSAKAKCDLSTPTCGRCTARGLPCSGAAQGNHLFLNENAIAQRNSWLARRPRGDNRTQSSTSGSRSPSQQPIELAHEDLRKLYYWLSDAQLLEVPQPLRRDVETRAVERFFLDWTLSPSNDGLSPGYMPDLPALYATAHPGSILWNAVRAVAFADLKEYDGIGGTFAAKAQQSYGAALTRMRAITEDSSKLTQDRILAALLLIDTFELMYISRREPMGPHCDALKHILLLRGEGQFLDRTKFELWRAAQQRLQLQRLTQRDDLSDEEPAGWIAKLNAIQPDLHVCVDVEKMVVLCAAGRRLLAQDNTRDKGVQVARAEELLGTMRGVDVSMEAWSSNLAVGWRPQRVGAHYALENDALGLFSCSPALEYSDPWLAYKWNFHAASLIVLRQSVVEVMEYASTLRSSNASSSEEGSDHTAELGEGDYTPEIAALQEATRKAATTIIESCIPLLGYATDSAAYPRGKMARRFFAGAAMWVVQHARLATTEQRQTAREVLRWIDRAHRLD